MPRTLHARTEDDRLARFTERAQEASATVHRLHINQVVGRLGDLGPIVVSPRLARRHPKLVAAVAGNGSEVSVASDFHRGRDIAVGVGTGELGVAETGSVLVDETDVCDRYVGLFAVHLVLVLEVRDIALSLDDAAAWFERQAVQPSYACLITGPSRTADIERSLTVGVQGAFRMEVILLS